jgi:hypothetical protein
VKVAAKASASQSTYDPAGTGKRALGAIISEIAPGG